MLKQRKIMNKQQLKFAIDDLQKGARHIASAGMRLDGSKHYTRYRQIWDAIAELNASMIEEYKR